MRSLGRAGARHSLLQYRLPLAKPGADREAVDSALDLGTPLSHVVLNVKQEGLLPKVGVHNLPRCLQAYGGVEVGLRRRMKCQSRPEAADSRASPHLPSSCEPKLGLREAQQCRRWWRKLSLAHPPARDANPELVGQS